MAAHMDDAHLAAASEEHKLQLKELQKTTDSLRRELEVTHALLGLSATLAEVRSIEETLELAVEVAAGIFGTDRSFGTVWDQHGGRFEVVSAHGHSDEELDYLRGLAASESGLPLLAAALDARRPLLVEDVEGEGMLSRDQARTRSLGAAVAIPLIRHGEAIGAIALEYHHPRSFDARDEALARGVARQVGAALANARRFQLLRQLRSFGFRIGSKLRMSVIIEEVTEAAATLLGAEGAAVYFHDQRSGKLLVAGHRGPPLGEDQARIDPVGQPWAALAEGRTVMVTEFRDHRAQLRPMTVLAAPVLARGILTGAVVVYFTEPPSLGVDETEALRVLAAQAAMAIQNAQRYERQRRVARSLQEGLLAMELVETPQFEFGSVYEPASGETEVGGDFFDVFELSCGRLGVVVGDVSGKGAEAAAQTAMAKYMLRAFATRNPTPSSVLYHLNNAVAQGFPEDRFVTILYGLLDPQTGSCQMATGGHPPPIVYRAVTGEVSTPPLEGVVLGAFEGEQFDQQTFELARGDAVVAFSDGLLDVRSGNDFFGREGIRKSLLRHGASQPAEKLAGAIF
ncbi:MAG TPA: SpoIIE family protein phosphatase, partial [Actinomycetota bacterium]|nr:SpoIIE family protein phosphatase [Actinomycetota bacterium]